MAVTIAKESPGTMTGYRKRSSQMFVRVKITFDASYPTGGESLATFGEPIVYGTFSGGGYIYEYDKANNKLKVMQGDNDNAADAPAVEVPNTTDLSAVVAEGLLFLDWPA